MTRGFRWAGCCFGYLACAVTASALIHPVRANAAPPTRSASSADADAWFRRGRAAAKRGAWEEAANAFRRSQDLEPAPGTTLNLGEALEQIGRHLEALEAYESALFDLPANDARRRVAQERVSILERRISWVVVELSGPSVAGTTVEWQRPDGTTLKLEALPARVRAHVGVHRLVLRRAGAVVDRAEVDVAERATARVVLRVHPARRDGVPAGESDASPRRSKDSTLAWTLLAGGGTLLAASFVTGWLVVQKGAVIDEHCDANRQCDATGASAASSASQLSTIATAFFVVGAGAGGAGLYLMPASRPERESHALPGLMLGARGKW